MLCEIWKEMNVTTSIPKNPTVYSGEFMEREINL
jgi:hypothetical protein